MPKATTQLHNNIMPIDADNLSSNIQHSTSLKGVTSANAMINHKYQVIKLGKYAKHWGEVAANFDLMFHGEPGAGKTYFLLTFANWFAQTFGPVLFCSNEEFGTVTLQNKIIETNSNNKNLFFSKSIDGVDLNKFKLLILDSINNGKITLDDYKRLRLKYPTLAVIAIMQKNKDGSFKGGKDWEHEFEIACELFFNDKNKRVIRTYKNRYGVMDTVKI